MPDGPQQRALLVGRDAGELETGELLALLFGGACTSAASCARLARLIDQGGSAVARAFPEELMADVCASPTAACLLAAAFELSRRAALAPVPKVIRGPHDVAAIAERELGGLRREHVLVVVCDAGNRPMRTIVVSQGAVDRALMPVREILNAVLRWDGRAFAVAHNHPSGDAEPSEADASATGRIADAAGVVGLRFLGHVVIDHGGRSGTC